MNLTNSPAADQDGLYAEAISGYGAALARLAVGYEVDAEKRRDLLQEIHVALWTSLAKFDGRCSLRTWVYRISHNVAINHVIKDKRHRDAGLVGLDELENARSHVDEMSTIDAGHSLEQLRSMIQKLKPPDRQIILLYLDDIDANAIAQITGMSPTNVATKIHRIKQLLARQFQSRGIS